MGMMMAITIGYIFRFPTKMADDVVVSWANEKFTRSVGVRVPGMDQIFFLSLSCCALASTASRSV